jgi:hypothetical protein
MFNYTHRGSLNEDYIILGIISYFLLNYPIKKKVNPIKILQRAQSVQEEIAEETEINQKKIARSLSMEYEQEQKDKELRLNEAQIRRERFYPAPKSKTADQKFYEKYNIR